MCPAAFSLLFPSFGGKLKVWTFRATFLLFLFPRNLKFMLCQFFVVSHQCLFCPGKGYGLKKTVKMPVPVGSVSILLRQAAVHEFLSIFCVPNNNALCKHKSPAHYANQSVLLRKLIGSPCKNNTAHGNALLCNIYLPRISNLISKPCNPCVLFCFSLLGQFMQVTVWFM